MKKLPIVTMLLAAALSGLAEPLQWVCEWPKAKAQQFELYQGEIATFEPTFRINGGAPTNLPVVTVWYQTNGMDRAWWHTDGAVFHPTNDVGAATYRFFVDAAGDGGKLYRANGTLRMLPSPGFVPNAITPPVAALDFDSIDVSNAPYYTKDETDAKIVELSPPADLSNATNYTDNVATTLRGEIAAAQPADYATVSNKAMTALQSYTETDPTIYSWAKAASKPTYTLNEVAPNSENWLGVQGNAGRTIKILAQGSGSSPAGGVQITASTLNNNNTTTYAYSGVAVKRNGVNTDFLWDESSPSGIARRAELTSATNSTFIAAANYTDKAIAEIPEPDYSTGNSALVATIAATAPPPGDYATVSNKAVNAVQSEWITQAEDGYRMGLGDGGLLIDRVDCDEVMFRAKYGPDRVVIGNNRKLGLDATGDLHGMWIGDDPLDVPRNTTLYENGMITRWDASGNLHEITIPTNQSQGTFALTSDIPGDYSTVSNKAVNAVQTSELSSLETDPTVPSWAKASSKPSYSASEVGAAPSSLTSAVSSLSDTVSFIETWAIGDETQLRIENAGQTNATLQITYTNDLMFSTAVAESNTLAKARADATALDLALADAFDTALAGKADRAWGNTTSSGAPSPADELIIEKPKLALTGGGNFSYIEASTGGYWVMSISLGSEWTLESLADAQNPTNPATIAMHDAEGNTAFTVTSTSSREAYTVTGEQYIYCRSVGGNDVITLTYPVVADSAPTIEYTPSLTNEFATVDNWPGYIASVVPTGHSGMWTNTVTMVGHPGKGFFKGKYTKAGHTYTRFNQPIGITQITIDDVTYDISVETINGKKLMVLTEAD